MDAAAVWLSLPLGVMVLHRAAVAAAWVRTARRAVPTGRDGAPRRLPVTWLRPIKQGVPGLAGKLERFLAGMEAEDEAIFGVEAGSEEERLCAELAGRDGRVKVIACGSGAGGTRRAACATGENPKVAKLVAMAGEARHERWVVVDAEARLEAEFARAFREEWEASGADVLTAGYRFVGMRTAVQWLDALATIGSLWPGLELVRAFGRVRFTLGACTGVRRANVESIGGWAALGDELAEDQQLGARLAAVGKTVRLSATVLDLESEPMTWRDYWRHQRRVAVTYRVSAPAGAFGWGFTRGFALCALLAVVWPSPLTALNAALAAGLHLFTVAGQGWRLGLRPGAWVALGLVADLVEATCWVLSWGSRRVWWGGKWRLITSHGQFRARDDTGRR